MSRKNELLAMANDNNGVLLAKDVIDGGFSKSTLQQLVKDGLIVREERGVYVTDGVYLDDFNLLTEKYKKGIFSHETALYLLGFSDRAPINITMSFEHGRSSTKIKKNGIIPIMVSNDFLLGDSMIKRNGTDVRVYSIERTLVDLIKPRYEADLEQLVPALKKYSTYKKRDINKLFEYARIFGVEKKMHDYMRVLI